MKMKIFLFEIILGVVFLSGGQSEYDASLNLNAVNRQDGKKPWTLTFSYGRGLQASALETWKGKDENVQKAQAVLLQKARVNFLKFFLRIVFKNVLFRF